MRVEPRQVANANSAIMEIFGFIDSIHAGS
jgi:hypothetical protein